MKDCYFYYPTSPLKERYLDSSEIPTLLDLLIKYKGKDYTASLLGEANDISLLRIIIPNCENEFLSEDDLHISHLIKEHMESILRITFDHGISFSSRMPYMAFREPGEESYKIDLSVKQLLNPDFEIDSENIKNVFYQTFEQKEDFKLLSDSMDLNIPLQYRYLSLFKIIENNFTDSRGRWNNEPFDEFLSNFDKGIRKKIFKFRAKCAHITDKKGKNGITQLSRKDIMEVQKFIPELKKIVVTWLNQNNSNITLNID